MQAQLSLVGTMACDGNSPSPYYWNPARRIRCIATPGPQPMTAGPLVAIFREIDLDRLCGDTISRL